MVRLASGVLIYICAEVGLKLESTGAGLELESVWDDLAPGLARVGLGLGSKRANLKPGFTGVGLDPGSTGAWVFGGWCAQGYIGASLDSGFSGVDLIPVSVGAWVCGGLPGAGADPETGSMGPGL